MPEGTWCHSFPGNCLIVLFPGSGIDCLFTANMLSSYWECCHFDCYHSVKGSSVQTRNVVTTTR